MRRVAALADARLYLCTGIRDEAFLDAVLGAGVDIVQLREKNAPRDDVARAAALFKAVTARHGKLFILNDDPELAVDPEARDRHQRLAVRGANQGSRPDLQERA